MPHASFLSPVQKNERPLLFFRSGECEPPKNVGRKFHWEKITNMASVSCVCWPSGCGQQVNFTADLPLMQDLQLWLASIHWLKLACTPKPLPPYPLLALYNRPTHPNRSESKQIKSATECFHLADIYMRVLLTDKISFKVCSQYRKKPVETVERHAAAFPFM